MATVKARGEAGRFGIAQNVTPPTGGLLTIKEVAAELRVHPNTVYLWVLDGRLEAVKLTGKTGWRVGRDQLNAFLASRRQGVA